MPGISTLFLRNQLRWVLLAIPLALLTGSLVALFLWLLDVVTGIRWHHPWLLFLLPLAGILIYFLYYFFGRPVAKEPDNHNHAEQGNKLIIREINKPGHGVPGSMAPLVFITTLVTHLFGGSAGREGTAVQIGGSLAAVLSRWVKLTPADLRIMLTCGIAAGFGAVFGTPFAGAVFALEVLATGLFRYRSFKSANAIPYQALLPCMVAALMADMVCAAWGIHHTVYQVLTPGVNSIANQFIHFNWLLAVKAMGAGVIFGLAAWLFIYLTELIKVSGNKLIRKKWLLPFIGGLVIIGLTYLLGTRDYLGLGVFNPDPHGVSLVSAFSPGGASNFSWFWKILFTAVTIGLGFKGGEVTPLFFIGATLGNTLAGLTGTPVDLMASLGFIAVFAGATNTPFACIIMGVELFGGEQIIYYAIACFAAFYCSGKKSIY